jgi:hypothetical protein
VAGSPDARGSLLINLDRILGIAQSSQRLRETGQSTMFDLFGEEVATPIVGIDIVSAPLPRGEVLTWEKELLGIWLSEHPFTRAAPELTQYTTALCNEINEDLLAELPSQGRDLIIAGMVGSTRRLTTRDGRAFIAAEFEDLSGSVEVTVWPDIYEKAPELWTAGSISLLRVNVRERADRLTVGVQQVEPYVESFRPPTWLNDPQPQPYGSGGRGTRNGNGYRNGNGNGNGGYRTEPAPPAVETPIEEPSPADSEPVDIEGGVTYETPPEAPFTVPFVRDVPAVAEPLSLVLTETEDADADQKRLSTVFSILQQQPGADPVHLTIETRDGDRIELVLPSAVLDEPLRAKLLEAVESI